MSALPREITVTRWVCPFCHRGRARRSAAEAHIARCWRNPDVRACRTCRFYMPEEPVEHGNHVIPASCGRGISLTMTPVPGDLYADGMTLIRSGCDSWAEVTA